MIFPLDYTKVVYLIVMTTLVGIANAGGLGGGGIAVPCLLLFFDCDPKTAINIAYIYILFGSLGNSIQNLRKTHPTNPSKSLINFDLALVSFTGIIYGAMIGYFLNKISYDIVIISVFFILQVQVLFRNQKKIRSLQQQVSNQPTQQIIEQLINNQQCNQNTNHLQIIQKMKYFIIVTIISIILILIKGSPKFPSIINLPLCGYLPLLYYVLMAIILILIYKKIQSDLIVQQGLDQNDIRFMNNNAINAFIAGLVGSFIGIGGGVILTANWLQMGLHPQENTATSTFVIIFTGFITVIQVFISGQYMIQEFILFAIISIIGSYIIANIVYRISKKLNLPFLTIYLLQALVFLGLIILIYKTVNKIMNDPDSLIRVKTFC